MNERELKIYFRDALRDFNAAYHRLQKVNERSYQISKIAAYDFGKILRSAYRIKEKVLEDCRFAFFLSSRSMVIGLDDAFDEAQKDTLAKYNQTAIIVELDLTEIKTFIRENSSESLKYIGEKMFILLNKELKKSLQKNNLTASKTLLGHYRTHYNTKFKQISDATKDDQKAFETKMNDLFPTLSLRKLSGIGRKYNRYYVQKTNNGYIFVDIKDEKLVVAFAYDEAGDYLIDYPLTVADNVFNYFKEHLTK